MGPENKNEYTVYRDGGTLGGTPVARGEIELVKITIPEEVMNPGDGFPYEYMGCTFYFKIPKRWRCRGRKRFMKLMMSEGIRRNNSEWLADFMRGWMPYGEAWRNYLLTGPAERMMRL